MCKNHPRVIWLTSSDRDNPQVEIFKSFRVAINDPCEVVLPVVSVQFLSPPSAYGREKMFMEHRLFDLQRHAIVKQIPVLTTLSPQGPQTLQYPRRLAAIRSLHRPRRPRALSWPERETFAPLQTTRQRRPQTNVHAPAPCESARRLERCGQQRRRRWRWRRRQRQWQRWRGWWV